MNHSSVKSLDWKTPMEKLHGKPTNISMFRFGFWAPVWYYQPTAKFLAPNFLPARHLGIASKHGDYFTYKVCTLPDYKWENGQELVRYIVTMRQHTDTSPRIDYTDEALTMSKNPCAEKSKRKKNQRTLKCRTLRPRVRKGSNPAKLSRTRTQQTLTQTTKGAQRSASFHPLSLNAQRQGRKEKIEATSLTTIRQFKI